MKLVTVTDERGGVSVRRVVSSEELATLSGVELAALLFPSPTEADIATVTEFLSHYRSGAEALTRTASGGGSRRGPAGEGHIRSERCSDDGGNAAC